MKHEEFLKTIWAPTSAHFTNISLLLEQLGGGAICAGGAIRDAVTGVPVKDIDCFLDTTAPWETNKEDPCSNDWYLSMERWAKGKGLSLDWGPQSDDYPHVFDLVNFGYPTLFGDKQVQVIALTDDPIMDMKFYDFNLSQMCMQLEEGGGYTICATRPALADLEAKTITYNGFHEKIAHERHLGVEFVIPVLRTDAAYIRSRKRYQRLKEKYPQPWRFVNCEKFDI